MKKRIPGLIAVMLMALGARTAMAEPYLAVMAGLKCSACHVNPTGGGKRTTFGSVYGQTQLPANLVGKLGAPLTGDIGKYIGIGADLRADYTSLHFPGTPTIEDTGITSLRAYLDLRIIPERLSFYVDERLAPGDAKNREMYLRLFSGDHRFFIKMGRMYLPFGIRLQDDTAFTREPTSINFNTPDRGIEVGFDGSQWTAQFAVSNGTAGGPEVDDGKQWSLRTEYVNAGWRAGASLNINDFDVGRRRMQNVFGGLRTGPVAWLGELDYIVSTTGVQRREQLAGLVEANWKVRQGHNLKFTAELFDPNRDASRDRQTRLSLVWEYTPMPFLQVRTGIRNYDDVNEVPFLNQRIAFIQLHGFL